MDVTYHAEKLMENYSNNKEYNAKELNATINKRKKTLLFVIYAPG